MPDVLVAFPKSIDPVVLVGLSERRMVIAFGSKVGEEELGTEFDDDDVVAMLFFID